MYGPVSKWCGRCGCGYLWEGRCPECGCPEFSCEPSVTSRAYEERRDMDGKILTAADLIAIIRSRGMTVYLDAEGVPRIGGNKVMFTHRLQAVLAHHRPRVIELLREEQHAARTRTCVYLLPNGKSHRSPMNLIPDEATAWQYEGETEWRKCEELPNWKGASDGEGRTSTQGKARSRVRRRAADSQHPQLFG